MRYSDEVIERYLRDELRVVNRSLPLKRRTLKELINEEIPYVITRDGGVHMFRKSELKLAYDLMGDKLSSKLYLPIILEVRTDIESETVMVLNDEVAAKLISKLLGMKDYTLPMYIYPLQLKVIREKIGTLIQYAFTLSFT